MILLDSDPTQYVCEDFAVAPHTPVEVLDSGAIRVRARLARTGIQEYDSWPGAPVQGRKIRLYRPAEEVFDPGSLATLRSNPVTVNHPPTGEVTADTWRSLAVGHVEGHELKRVTVDGPADGSGEEFIETSIVVSDADAIRRVQLPEGHEDRLREFSSGYAMTIDWTPGEYKGEKYDGVQRSIRHNHQALLRVGDARAGRGARIVDARNQNEEDPMKFEELKKALDEMTKRAEKAESALADAKKASGGSDSEKIAKLEADLKTANDALAETKVKLGEALAKQTPALDSNAIEIAVAERVALQDAARGMLPADYVFAGKSSAQVKLDAVAACRPELAKSFGDKPDAALVEGAFRALQDAKTVYVKPKPALAGDADNRTEYQKHLDSLAEQNRKALEAK